MTNQTTVPEGYMRNGVGHLVPIAQVREQDMLRDQVARNLAEQAEAIHKLLVDFKTKAFSDIADLVRIAGDRYSVTLGGERGGITVSTYDQEFKVVRSVADRITLTEEIEAAEVLVTECLSQWKQESNAHLHKLAARAFRKNAQGKLCTTDILNLLRVEIEDATWKRAMKAITDSIQVSGTATYVRVYRRKPGTGAYEAIPLDLAAV